MERLPTGVTALAESLTQVGWVSDLLVAGSLATGDHVAGVSDLDLVAVVQGPVDGAREATLRRLHRELDRGAAAGAGLGCAYVAEATIAEPAVRHPTWTHGALVRRPLSGISRAELARHGFAVHGRPPAVLFPPVTDDQVRDAARAEVCGYWSWAARRPWLWLDPVVADLALTAMARGRHTMRTGRLLTKTEAVAQARAPRWLVDDLAARRRGERVVSPRVRTAWIAWRDTRRTVVAARRSAVPPLRGPG